MKKSIVIVIILLVLAAVAAGYIILRASGPKPGSPDAPLFCHVGGTMRPVMEKLAEVYTEQTGKKIEISSAGSGELMATIELHKKGDLYVCHDPFMDRIMKRGLGVNAYCIGELVPVIIVQKGNPLKVKDLHDIIKPEVRLCLTDYTLSTLGNMLPLIFSKAGIDFKKLNKDKEITIHRSGSYVANLIKMNSGDAAMVWQAVATLRKDALDMVFIDSHLPVPEVDTITSATGKKYFVTPVKVTAITLTCSNQLSEAEEFLAFIVSEQGAKIIEEYGFRATPKYTKQFYKNGKLIGQGEVKQ
jgi:ABC-type molybdate transport system substrate-binding protein